MMQKNVEFEGILVFTEKVKYKIFSDRLIIFKGAMKKLENYQSYLLMADLMKFITHIGKICVGAITHYLIMV